VAARAGLRHGDREPRIEIEFLAERGFFRRVWIFLRERDRRRTLVLRLHRIHAGSRFRRELDAARLADDDCTEADAGKAERTDTDEGGDGRTQE
jgi:hypothetical protein